MNNMKKTAMSAAFVTTHYVDESYHQQHPQLVHLHENVLELLYIIKGTGIYIVDGQNYKVSRGDLIICNQATLHGENTNQAISLESYSCVLTGLQLPGLPPNTLCTDTQSPVLHFDFDKIPIENIMTTLHTLNNISAETYCNACQSLADALLDIVQIKMINQEQSDAPVAGLDAASASHSRREFIREVTKYLDLHYTEPITLSDLSKTFHISHHHPSHTFKSETGISPMKYIIHRRIGESQNLLMNTDMLISDICASVGFIDNSYFSTIFKKYVGLTPSEYRNHFR